jgi:hypothetical protein
VRSQGSLDSRPGSTHLFHSLLHMGDRTHDPARALSNARVCFGLLGACLLTRFPAADRGRPAHECFAPAARHDLIETETGRTFLFPAWQCHCPQERPIEHFDAIASTARVNNVLSRLLNCIKTTHFHVFRHCAFYVGSVQYGECVTGLVGIGGKRKEGTRPCNGRVTASDIRQLTSKCPCEALRSWDGLMPVSLDDTHDVGGRHSSRAEQETEKRRRREGN